MSNSAILDLQAVEEAKEMMGAKFPKIVKYFLDDAENYIGDVREGVAAASAQRIVAPAHTLKSSAYQVGAYRLSEIAANAEMLARQQSDAGVSDMNSLAALLAKLEAAFAETKDALANLDPA